MTPKRLLSVNVGLPREVEWQGKVIRTSIFKAPVAGTLRVSMLKIEGDEQADPSVHGGIDKAICFYPHEHYPFWYEELGNEKLSMGSFGENFTTEGLLEDSVFIGDRLRVGSAVCSVTQPRMPCLKLGARFGRQDIIKRFLDSGRSGFYVRVLQEGEVRAGDTIEILSRDQSQVSVADIVALFNSETDNDDLLNKVIDLETLPDKWRSYFRKRVKDTPPNGR
jgi:MOSC domain-containing protein YiiM